NVRELVEDLGLLEAEEDLIDWFADLPPLLPPSAEPSDPSFQPPASESRTPPQPIDPMAPPWLLAPSSSPLPHPSGFALGCRRPSCTSGLYTSGFASSLRLRQAPPSLRLTNWTHELQH
ncbi:hypothetical protein M9458_046872, partial [Cirrhinus mrigala]